LARRQAARPGRARAARPRGRRQDPLRGDVPDREVPARRVRGAGGSQRGGRPLRREGRLHARTLRAAMRVALLLLAALAGTSAPAQQGIPSPAPAFPSQVELVTVDAVVVDAKGRAVPGLTAADFTVIENGVPQAITRFEAVQLPAGPAPPPSRNAPFSTNQSPEARQGRTFVLVFDDIHL